MIPLAALVALTCMTIMTSKALSRERAMFLKYGNGLWGYVALQMTLWLYPIPGFLAQFAGYPVYRLFFAIPLAVLFYVPGLIVGKQYLAKFERAGTDLVKRVIVTVDQSIWLAYGCIVCVLLLCLLYWYLRLL